MERVKGKMMCVFFFFQAEDGIRDRSPVRGLGDVYKRQRYNPETGSEYVPEKKSRLMA